MTDIAITAAEEIELIADALTAAIEAWDEHYADDYSEDEAHISLQKSISEDGEVEWTAEIAPSFDEKMTNWKDGDAAAADIAMIRDGDAITVAGEYHHAWDEDFTDDARVDEDEDLDAA